jgi:UTP--glucose-1-phosphate uridylyltransferase
VGGAADARGWIRATELVEKPKPEDAPSRKALIGRYVLSPAIFPMLSQTRPGKGGEIQLTDGLAALARGPGLFAVDLQGIRYDVGTHVGFLEANIAYALKRNDLREPVRALLKRMQQ